MKVVYEVVESMVVKKYEDGDLENFCLLKDIDIVIDRTRDTLDRMDNILRNIDTLTEKSPLRIMFNSYAFELNELKKISLLNK